MWSGCGEAPQFVSQQKLLQCSQKAVQHVAVGRRFTVSRVSFVSFLFSSKCFSSKLFGWRVTMFRKWLLLLIQLKSCWSLWLQALSTQKHHRSFQSLVFASCMKLCIRLCILMVSWDELTVIYHSAPPHPVKHRDGLCSAPGQSFQCCINKLLKPNVCFT